MSTIATLVTRFQADTSNWKQGVTDVLRGGSDLTRMASGLGKEMSIGTKLGIAGAVAAGVALYKLGSDFQDSHNRIQRETGATGKQLDSLYGSMKNVFKQRPENMGEVTDAIIGVHRASGLTGDSLEKVASNTLRLSSLTREQFQPVLKNTQQLMQNWNIEGGKQNEKLNVLYRAFQQTGIPVAELSKTMSTMGPTLRGLGFGFEQSAAMVGLFHKAGIPATQMQMGFNKVMGEAAKQGRPAKDLFDEMFKRMRDAPDDISASSIAMEVMGIRAGPRFAQLVREGKLSFDEMAQSLVSGEDTIRKTASETATASGRMKIAWHTLQVAVEPIARGLANFVRDIAGGFINLLQAAGPVIPILLGVGAALWFISTSPTIALVIGLVLAFLWLSNVLGPGPALMITVGVALGIVAAAAIAGKIAVSGLASSFMFLIAPLLIGYGVFLLLKDKIGTLPALFIGLSVALGIAAGMMFLLGSSTWAALAPWLLLLAPIVLGVGLFIWLKDKIGPIPAALIAIAVAAGIMAIAMYVLAGGVWAAIAPILILIAPILLIVAAVAAVIAIIVLLIVYWDQVWNACAIAIKWFWNEVCLPIWEGMKIAWQAVVDAIMVLWNTALKPVWDAFATVVSWLWNNILSPIFEAIKAVFTTVGDIIAAVWNNVISPIFEIFKAVAQVVFYIVVIPILLLVAAIWWALSEAISAAWNYVIKPAWDAIAAVITWLWNSVLSPIFNLIRSVFEAVGAAIAWVWSSIIKPAWDALAAAAGWLWNNVLGPIFGFIGSAFEAMGRGLKWVWDTIINPVVEVFKSAFNTAKDVFGTVVDAIGKAWDGLKKALGTPVKFVIEKVINPLVRGANFILDKIGLKIPEIDASSIPSFQMGGRVPGGFGGGDKQLIMAEAGEYVIPKEQARALGYGALAQGAITSMMEEPPGYIFGGIVDFAKDVGSGIKGVGEKALDVGKDAVGAVAGIARKGLALALKAIALPLKAVAQAMPGGWWGKAFGDFVAKLIDDLIDWVGGGGDEKEEPPAAQMGGLVTKQGLIEMHAGELVIPAAALGEVVPMPDLGAAAPDLSGVAGGAEEAFGGASAAALGYGDTLGLVAAVVDQSLAQQSESTAMMAAGVQGTTDALGEGVIGSTLGRTSTVEAISAINSANVQATTESMRAGVQAITDAQQAGVTASTAQQAANVNVITTGEFAQVASTTEAQRSTVQAITDAQQVGVTNSTNQMASNVNVITNGMSAQVGSTMTGMSQNVSAITQGMLNDFQAKMTILADAGWTGGHWTSSHMQTQLAGATPEIGRITRDYGYRLRDALNPILKQTGKGEINLGYQTGGKISGTATPGDRVPILAEQGEYVISRKAALRLGYGALDKLNRGWSANPRDNLPAHYAGGGVVEAANAIMGAVGGLRVTSHVRPGDTGYHGRGMAIDLGGSVGAMNAGSAWITQSGMWRQLTEGIYAGSPALSVKNGAAVGPGFWGGGTWAAHADHIHIAVGGEGMIMGIQLPELEQHERDALRKYAKLGEAYEGMADYVREKAQEWVDENSFWGGAGAAPPEQVRAWIEQAMAFAGVSGADWMAMLSWKVMQESSGNPNIVQGIRDVNSGGNEAVGLMQIIPATFAAYRDPRLPDDRRHPIANLVAAIRYIIGRYGGPAGVPKSNGYALGGIVPARPGGRTILAGEGGYDEAVIPLPKGWRSSSGRHVPEGEPRTGPAIHIENFQPTESADWRRMMRMAEFEHRARRI